MNEKSQRELFQYLNHLGLENFIGVPDSTMKHFIDEGIKSKKILITTREEEAIGIGAGIVLSGKHVVIFMQNAGFANSLSTISSLIQLYQIPMILLIGWRGFLSKDAPEHRKIGKIQTSLLKTMGIKSRILTENNFKKNVKWAISELKKYKTVSLVIRREFLD